MRKVVSIEFYRNDVTINNRKRLKGLDCIARLDSNILFFKHIVSNLCQSEINFDFIKELMTEKHD
jgi:hypothetical protein